MHIVNQSCEFKIGDEVQFIFTSRNGIKEKDRVALNLLHIPEKIFSKKGTIVEIPKFIYRDNVVVRFSRVNPSHPVDFLIPKNLLRLARELGHHRRTDIFV